MKSWSIQYLRSPIDGSPLRLEGKVERDGEVESGSLVDGSGNSFPILNGVPCFAESSDSDETFSFKWKLIGESYGHIEPTRSNRRGWYLERFGFTNKEELMKFLGNRDFILDAGTGSGVDAAMFAESGAHVFAVDLSREAARVAYSHVGRLPNVHVLQADINHLPFSEGLFGYISCDQVLHHTPNAEESFGSLVNCLKRDGHLAVYVYKRKSPIREFTDDYVRGYTTQMSVQECYEFSSAVTLLGKALADLKMEVTIPEGIPLLGIEAGTQEVQRFFYWNFMKCFWNDEYDFKINAAINFDWYHPKYASRHTVDEVEGWFLKRGLEVEKVDIIPSGISVLGKLPMASINK